MVDPTVVAKAACWAVGMADGWGWLLVDSKVAATVD